MQGAVIRLVVDYPRHYEALIDEAGLREAAAQAFEFHLVKRPRLDTRIRLPEDQSIGSMTPLELLNIYWRAAHTEPPEVDALNVLAAQIIHHSES
jgi:exonuclease SbcD